MFPIERNSDGYGVSILNTPEHLDLLRLVLLRRQVTAPPFESAILYFGSTNSAPSIHLYAMKHPHFTDEPIFKINP